jgi:DNA-binding CsgD family transcriptional regulator
MLLERDAEDLIQPLIEGVVEDPVWSTFLDRLRLRTAADYASIVFRPLRTGPLRNRVIHQYSGLASPPPVSKLYHDSLHVTDPMPYREMAESRVYSLGDLLLADDPRHQAYREQMLVPSGMNIMRMMRLMEESGVSAWITLSRCEGEFTPAADALFAAIGPYLRAALRSFVTLEKAKTKASVANEAIRRMNFGWLALDSEGRIHDADANAAAMLAAPNVLIKGRGGRLTARSPETAREIAEAVRVLAGDIQARPRAIVLNRDPWLDMLLVSTSVRAEADADPDRLAPSIIAYVHADTWSSADRCEQLGELFDLIPSEARLALALTRGMSLAEAAGELGLTVESARTYSKRIYAKTGARGQADLVRFIHRSVLAIA